MVKFSEHISGINDKILYKMIDKLVKHFDAYKESRGNFPKDSDGLYILLEGSVTVKNDFSVNPDGTIGPPKDLYNTAKQDNKNVIGTRGKATSNVKQERPEMLDVFGAEKFLQVQGYSYYGSMYSTEQKSGGTTCGFIKQEFLYLLPFYDQYRLKEDLEERYKVRCEKLKKNSHDTYKYIL
jgi:hypothetical protein